MVMDEIAVKKRMREEQHRVLEEGRRKREGKAAEERQKILLWEMGEIRRIEEKYRAELNRLRAQGGKAPARPEKARQAEAPMDKRPSSKAKKLRVSN